MSRRPNLAGGVAFVVSIGLWAIPASQANAQSSVPLQLVSAFSSAVNAPKVYVWNQNDPGAEDEQSEGATGTTSALASTMSLSRHAVKQTQYPPIGHGIAYGYSEALAGYGRNNTTSALCYRYLWIHTEAGAYAGVLDGHSPYGEAFWKIPEGTTGNTWIQADIEISGAGAWRNTGTSNARSKVETTGTVWVADSSVEYYTYANGTIHIDATLYDLDDVAHEVHADYPGPILTLTVRQHIAPGTEFRTYADHNSGNGTPFELENVSYQAVTVGLAGTTFARSRHLEAYVGDP